MSGRRERCWRRSKVGAMGDWKKIKLKYVVDSNMITLSENTAADKKISYIDIGAVDSDGKINTVRSLSFSDAPSRARRIVRVGDVIVSTVRTYLCAIACIDEKYDGCVVSTGFAVLTPKKDLYSRFLGYVLRSQSFLSYVEKKSCGIAYPSVTINELKGYEMLLPPLDEQRAIAAFLDARTSNIRRLIELRTREIELLHEYKRALISEEVARSEGSPVRLKYIVTIKNGGDCPKYDEGLYPVIGSGGEFARTDRFIYDKPSVLLGRVGTIDKPLYVDEPFCVANTMFYTVPKIDIDMKFFYYCCTQIDFNRYKSGTAMPLMTQQELYSIKVPLPPLEEQRAVAAFLDRKCRTVDRLIDNCQRQILLLRELQRATISEAVTGKTPNIATGG